MSYNTFLAAISVFFAWLFSRFEKTSFKIISVILWLLFLPNTIYIITDLTHLPAQFYTSQLFIRPILVFQYSLLLTAGIITYFWAMYLFEKKLLHFSWVKNKKTTPVILLMYVNFLVSIGVMMGRIQRSNSWDVFFHTKDVVYDAFFVLQSLQIMIFVVVFTVLITVLYFLLKDIVSTRRKLSKLFSL